MGWQDEWTQVPAASVDDGKTATTPTPQTKGWASDWEKVSEAPAGEIKPLAAKKPEAPPVKPKIGLDQLRRSPRTLELLKTRDSGERFKKAMSLLDESDAVENKDKNHAAMLKLPAGRVAAWAHGKSTQEERDAAAKKRDEAERILNDLLPADNYGRRWINNHEAKKLGLIDELPHGEIGTDTFKDLPPEAQAAFKKLGYKPGTQSGRWYNLDPKTGEFISASEEQANVTRAESARIGKAIFPSLEVGGMAQGIQAAAGVAARIGEKLGIVQPGTADASVRLGQAKEDVAQKLDEGSYAGKVIRGAASSFTQMGIGGLLGVATGGASTAATITPAVIGTFGATAANEAYTNAKDSGLSEPEAQDHAVKQGLIEGGITAAFQAAGAGGLESAFFRNQGKALAKDAVGKIVKNISAEQLEEWTVTAASEFAARASGMAPSDLPTLLADTFVQTAATMGLVESPAITRQATKDFGGMASEDVTSRAANARKWIKENPGYAEFIASQFEQGKPITRQMMSVAGLKTGQQEQRQRFGKLVYRSVRGTTPGAEIGQVDTTVPEPVEAPQPAKETPAAVAPAEAPAEVRDARRALAKYIAEEGYDVDAKKRKFMEDDTKYQALKDAADAEVRSENAKQAARTKLEKKAHRDDNVVDIAVGNHTRENVAYAPTKLMHPTLRAAVQQEAAKLLETSEAADTKAALQKIIAGEDGESGDVEAQRERIISVLMGEKDQRSVKEREGGAPRRPVDPIVSMMLKPAAERKKALSRAMQSVVDGEPDGLATYARNQVEKRQTIDTSADIDSFFDTATIEPSESEILAELERIQEAVKDPDESIDVRAANTDATDFEFGDVKPAPAEEDIGLPDRLPGDEPKKEKQGFGRKTSPISKVFNEIREILGENIASLVESPDGLSIRIGLMNGKSFTIAITGPIRPTAKQRAAYEASIGKKLTDDEYYSAFARGTFQLVMRDQNGRQAASGDALIRLAQGRALRTTPVHELVHLARALGMFTDAEWSALKEKHAKKGMSEIEAEEKIARAFEDWHKTSAGWKKLKLFVDKLLSYFTKKMTATRAMGNFSSGEVFGRNANVPTNRDLAVRWSQPAFSAGTEERQTETKAFKNWFGDSKVVDANGKPLVMYHGSPKNDIKEFKVGFFDSDPERAGGYTTTLTEALENKPGSGSIYPVYLSIQNPLRTKNEYDDRIFDKKTGGYNFKALEEQGYDGILAGSGKFGYVAIPFHSNQVKSAIGNRGTFDPNSPNMLFSTDAGAETDTEVADARRAWKDLSFRSPWFKRWFGGSKIVDKRGDPIRMFHGTTAEFDTFRMEYADKNALYGPGIYLTDSPEVAAGDNGYTTKGVFRDENYVETMVVKPGETKEEIAARVKELVFRDYGDVDDQHIYTKEGESGGARAVEIFVDEISSPNVMPLYVKIAKPFDIDADMPNYDRDLGRLQDLYPEVDFDYSMEKLREFEDNNGTPGGREVYTAIAKSNDENGNRIGKARANAMLQALGYDGIVHTGGLSARYGSGKPHKVAIAFDPSQVKSAIGNAGTFDPGTDNVLFSAEEKPRSIWRDNILDALKSWQGKGTPDQLKKHLEKTRGAIDQAKWIGLDEFLEGKKSVTKKEVEDFTAANAVEVQDVLMGAGPTKVPLAENLIGQPERIEDRGDGNEWFVIRRTDTGEVLAEGYSAEAAQEELSNSYNGDEYERYAAPETKYHGYQTPGGENYRELLLTLPERTSVNKGPKGWGTVDGGTYDEANYHSSHFDVPNIVAHVRYNERTTADGKRMLFLDELQSDWGQQLRRQGGPSKNVPDMPFAKSWPMLAMRRMIQHASENGFDSIGWTTGEMQEKRYWGDELISPAVARWNKLTKPDSAGEKAADYFGAKMASMPPLKVVDAAVLDSTKNDKVRQAVIQLIPVDVVNVLAKNGFAPEQLFRNDDVVSDALSINDRSTVARGLSSSLQLTGANLRTALIDHLTLEPARGDKELIPAVLASDLDPSIVMRFLSSGRGVGGDRNNSIPGSKEAFARTESTGVHSPKSDLTRENGKLTATEIADAFNRHAQIVADKTGQDFFDLAVQPPPGEGMKGFYDKILPADVNKFVKKWGTKVGTTEIVTDKGSNSDFSGVDDGGMSFLGEGDVHNPVTMTVHNLPLNQAMIADAAEGMPLFSATHPVNYDKPKGGAVGSWIRWLLTSAGDLPKAAFALKENMQQFLSAHDAEMKFAIRDARKAARKVYGRDSLKHGSPEWAEVDAVMRGADILTLPEPLRDPVYRMRSHIDKLSKMIISSGVANDNLAATIEENMGTYLTRTYRIHADKNWSKRVPVEIRNRAEVWIRDQLTQKNGSLIPPTDNEVEAEIRLLLYQNPDSPMGMIAQGKLGSKLLDVIKARKEIPLELRQLWGEETNPLVNYAASVAKMTKLLAGQRFLTQARAAGMGTWLFERNDPERDPDAVELIAAKGSDTMSPLNGLLTYPEVAKAFRDEFRRRDLHPMFKFYLGLNSLAKVAKTVGSVKSQVRNNVSNAGFLAANGNLRFWKVGDAFAGVAPGLEGTGPFGVVVKGLGKAAGKLFGSTPGQDYDAWRQFHTRLTQLGIVGEEVNVGEFKQLLSEADFEHGNKLVNNLVTRGIKATGEAAAKVYQGSDAFWKILAWANERQRYKNVFPEWSDAQLDKAAADIVRNTMPTYAKIPKGVQALRYVPFGNFFSWSAEIIRVTLKTFEQAFTELKDKRTRGIGATRLAGASAMVIVPEVVIGSLAYIMGVTPGDDEDRREFVPPWSKNSQIAWLGDGKYLDISFMDPYAYLRKSVHAYMRGDEDGVLNGVMETAKELVSPFADEQLLGERLTDLTLRGGKTSDGRQIYNPEDDLATKAAAAFKHVAEVVVPGTFTDINNVRKAALGVVGEHGKEYDLQTELQAMLGLRISKIDIPQSLGFKVTAHDAAMTLSNQLFTRTALNTGNVSDSDLAAAYARADVARRRNFDGMHEAVWKAIRQGTPKTAVAEVLRARGISKDETERLLSGQYRPLLPSRQTLAGIAATPDGERRVAEVYRLWIDHSPDREAAEAEIREEIGDRLAAAYTTRRRAYDRNAIRERYKAKRGETPDERSERLKAYDAGVAKAEAAIPVLERLQQQEFGGKLGK